MYSVGIYVCICSKRESKHGFFMHMQSPDSELNGALGLKIYTLINVTIVHNYSENKDLTISKQLASIPVELNVHGMLLSRLL